MSRKAAVEGSDAPIAAPTERPVCRLRAKSHDGVSFVLGRIVEVQVAEPPFKLRAPRWAVHAFMS